MVEKLSLLIGFLSEKLRDFIGALRAKNSVLELLELASHKHNRFWNGVVAQSALHQVVALESQQELETPVTIARVLGVVLDLLVL